MVLLNFFFFKLIFFQKIIVALFLDLNKLDILDLINFFYEY